MSREQRAKQFAPFAALTSLPANLAKKERVVVDRPALSDDYQEEINRTLQSLRPGQMVHITYYDNGQYIGLSGLISRMRPEEGYLQIVEKRILFSDLLTVRVE